MPTQATSDPAAGKAHFVDWLPDQARSVRRRVSENGSDMVLQVRKTAASEAPRAWQRMLSGRRLDLLDPSPMDVEIEDIAHGLARVARWNGQTKGDLPFNVAQHSLVVEEFCALLKPGWPVKWRLAALLHDAPEFVIGDMISPFKAQLGNQYKEIEKRLSQAIHLRFSLPADLPDTVEKTIKRADRASAYFEATQLAGFDAAEARRFFGPPRGVGTITIKTLTAVESQKRYLARFQALMRALDG